MSGADVERLLDRLQAGLSVDGMTVRAVEVHPGRFREERIVKVAARRGAHDAYVAMLMVYAGRPPLYRPWVEVYAQVPYIRWPDGSTTPFLDAPAERVLLTAVGNVLGPGGCVYVDCEADDETRLGMSWGVPEPVTRVGVILWELGFTWFKAWYYPEGLREGGQKLQAEKPVDAEAARRHRARWVREVERFLARAPSLADHSYVRRALERAQRWLATYGAAQAEV